MIHCLAAPLPNSSTLSLLHWNTAPQLHCSTASVPHCDTVPPSCCSTISLLYRPTVPLPRCSSASGVHWLTVSLIHCSTDSVLHWLTAPLILCTLPTWLTTRDFLTAQPFYYSMDQLLHRHCSIDSPPFMDEWFFLSILRLSLISFLQDRQDNTASTGHRRQKIQERTAQDRKRRRNRT
jgi:hypothetical protein